MGAALRLGDQLIDFLRIRPHLLGNLQMGENMPDIPQARVVMVAVGVTVVVLVGVSMVVFMVMLMVVVVRVAVKGLLLNRLVDVFMAVGVEVHILALLLFPVDGDGHMGAGDAALHRRLGGKFHPGKAQAVHALHKALGVWVQL